MSDTPFADKVLGVGRDRLEEREGAHWGFKAKWKASVCLENPKKNQQRGDGIFLISYWIKQVLYFEYPSFLLVELSRVWFNLRLDSFRNKQ